MQPNLVNVSNRRWKKSGAYEGLMGFEGKLIISPDSSLKEVRRTYKRGSYDEKWNIILTNPQSTTVISRSSSGRQHSSNVVCCPNGKIMAAKLAPAESAWSKHHEWSEEIKVDVLRTVQQCLRYLKKETGLLDTPFMNRFCPKTQHVRCWNPHHWHQNGGVKPS